MSVEAGVGVVSGCLPGCKPLMNKLFPRVFDNIPKLSPRPQPIPRIWPHRPEPSEYLRQSDSHTLELCDVQILRSDDQDIVLIEEQERLHHYQVSRGMLLPPKKGFRGSSENASRCAKGVWSDYHEVGAPSSEVVLIQRGLIDERH